MAQPDSTKNKIDSAINSQPDDSDNHSSKIVGRDIDKSGMTISVATQQATKVFLPYLAVLATLYTLYLAKTLLLPVVIATFISLFSSPIVSRLERFRIPRTISSIFVLGVIILVFASIFLIFMGPAQVWWEKLPTIADEMTSSINDVTLPFEDVVDESIALANSDNISNDRVVEIAGSDIRQQTFLAIFKTFASATPVFLTQLLATVFLIYFFLVYGHVLMLRVVESTSSLSDARIAVTMVSSMQQKLSNYVASITIINFFLGLTVGLVFHFIGIEDAFLWGALAGALNFAPYIGPMVAAIAFSLVAYIQFDSVQMALIVPGVYLGINLLECQFVTPTLLGNTLELNPLVVFIWLLLWGWIWGGFGMLVGVPLLVCLTIYLENTGVVGEWYKIVKNKRET